MIKITSEFADVFIYAMVSIIAIFAFFSALYFYRMWTSLTTLVKKTDVVFELLLKLKHR